MKRSRNRTEPTGRMVDLGGHLEFVEDPYDDPEEDNPVRHTESMAIVEMRRRHDGWTADRQRLFLNVLANTGDVALAAEAADITARSAYRLRNHPRGAPFARAWEAALLTAAGRLTTVAFERALCGTPRTIWRDGRIVAQQSIPSDRMLMFLLRHLNPALFAPDGDPAARAATIAGVQADFAPAMAAIADTDVECDILDIDDYRPHPPRADSA